MVVFLVPIWLVIFGLEILELRRAKQLQLESLFQEFLVCLTAGLRVGYSLPNAFEGALKELILMHGEKHLLIKEMRRVCRALREGICLEEMVSDIGKDLECKAMQELGEVLQIASLVGGNMTKTITETTKLLHERHVLRQEIEDGLTGRRFEARIMECVPFLMVQYVEMGSPGFFATMYESKYGILVMSMCLVAYAVSKIWTYHIVSCVMEGC